MEQEKKPVERKLAGTVEDVEDKGKYLRLKINGTWYSSWEKVVPRIGEVWAFNAYSSESRGKTYTNCVDMMLVPKDATQQTQLPAGAEKAIDDMLGRERRMMRQTSVNAAATFLQPAADKNIKVLLAYAEEIEKWINR